MSTTSVLTVTTGEAGEAQAELAREALHSQRSRLPRLFQELDAETWNERTRCAEWSVHEVVRHLCDVTLKWLGMLRGEDLRALGLEGMDPRKTPVGWLEQSRDQSPAETAAVFEQASALLLEEVDRRADRGADDRVRFVYGNVAWSALALHVFWDAWVHERDILLPQGRPHMSPEIESRAAAAYGVVMSGAPSVVLGQSLDETFQLQGPGGGVFHLQVHDGIVTTTLTDDPVAADPLRGQLPAVVDSLVGRGSELTEVLHGPSERVERMAVLRRFMRSPVFEGI